jgi:hypothetical protein
MRTVAADKKYINGFFRDLVLENEREELDVIELAWNVSKRDIYGEIRRWV